MCRVRGKASASKGLDVRRPGLVPTSTHPSHPCLSAGDSSKIVSPHPRAFCSASRNNRFGRVKPEGGISDGYPRGGLHSRQPHPEFRVRFTGPPARTELQFSFNVGLACLATVSVTNRAPGIFFPLVIVSFFSSRDDPHFTKKKKEHAASVISDRRECRGKGAPKYGEEKLIPVTGGQA